MMFRFVLNFTVKSSDLLSSSTKEISSGISSSSGISETLEIIRLIAKPILFARPAPVVVVERLEFLDDWRIDGELEVASSSLVLSSRKEGASDSSIFVGEGLA